ncbi:MAG: tetratricopeptide repeat protein [bacterium]|nr:tetratricopeptide repeat protein [bacterium]
MRLFKNFALVILICLITANATADSLSRGWKALYQNRYDEAIEYFSKDIGQNKNAVSAYEGMAFAYEARGKYDEMLNSWLKILKEDPDSARSTVILQSMLNSSNKFNKLTDYKKAIKVLAKTLKKGISNQRNKFLIKQVIVKFYNLTHQLKKAEKIYASFGYVTEWAVIGPFGRFGRSCFYEEFPPEQEIKFDASYQGYTGEIRWRRFDGIFRNGLVDFKQIVKPNVGCAYALTFIYSPFRQDVIFKLQTPHAWKAWVNYQCVSVCDRYKNFYPLTNSFPVSLEEGWNSLLIKSVCDVELGSWTLKLRVTDLKEKNCTNLKFTDNLSTASLRGVPKVPKAFGSTTWQPETELLRESLPRNDIECLDDKALNYYYTGMLLYFQGLQDKGIKYLKNAVELQPKFSGFLYAIGKTYEQARFLPKIERENKAKDFYNKVIEYDSQYVPALGALGLYFERNKLYEEAIEKFRHTIKINSEFAHGYVDLGRVYRNRGWDLEATKSIDFALKINPELKDALVLKAKLYTDRTQFNKAERIYKKIGNIPVSLLLRQGKYDQAVEQYNASIKANPLRTDLRLELGRLYSKLGDQRGAYKQYKDILDIIPTYSMCYKLLGTLLYAEHMTNSAIEAWESALKLNPRDYELRNLLAEIKTSTAPYTLKKFNTVKLISDNKDLSELPNAYTAALYNGKVIILNTDGSYKEIVHRIVKILSEIGIEKYGEIYIPGNLEELRVFLKDGTILEPVKIKGKNTYSIHGLEKDAVIEYKYTVEHKSYNIAKDYFRLPPFYFQAFNEALLWSRYTVILPSDINVSYISKNLGGNIVKEEKNLEGNKKLVQFECHNIPGVTEEVMMPPEEDVLPNIIITASMKLDKVSDLYRSLIMGTSVVTSILKDTTYEIIKACNTPHEKAEAIYYYINRTIKHNSAKFEPAISTLAEKSGNKAILLKVMLDIAGLDATYVLVRPNTFAKMATPYYGAFSTPLVKLNLQGNNVWLDISNKYLKFGEISSSLTNGDALVFNTTNYQTCKTPPLDLSANGAETSLVININRDINGKSDCLAEETYPGNLSGLFRLVFLEGIEKNLWGKYIEKGLANSFGEPVLEKAEFPNIDNPEEPFRIKYKFKISDFLQQVSGQDDEFIFNPIPFKLELSKKYIQKTQRKFPIKIKLEFTPLYLDQQFDINIPDNFIIKDTPQDITEESKFGKYLVKFTFNKNTLKVKQHFELFPQEISALDYPKFVDFCRRIDALEKKTISLQIKTVSEIK